MSLRQTEQSTEPFSFTPTSDNIIDNSSGKASMNCHSASNWPHSNNNNFTQSKNCYSDNTKPMTLKEQTDDFTVNDEYVGENLHYSYPHPLKISPVNVAEEEYDERNDRCHSANTNILSTATERSVINEHEGAHDSTLESNLQREGCMESEEIVKRNSGTCQQLRNTIWRIFLLQRRHRCAYFCELFIPIIFVIGSIIIWSIFDNSHYRANVYYSAVFDDYIYMLRYSQRFRCYNDSIFHYDNENINETDVEQYYVGSCSNASFNSSEGQPIMCGNAENGVPEWFCTTPSAASFTNSSFSQAEFEGALSFLSLDWRIIIYWSNFILYNKIFSIFQIRGRTKEAAIMAGGQIIFTPDSDETANLVNYFNSTSLYFRYVYGGTMSEDDANNKILNRKPQDPQIWSVIHVKHLNKDAFDVEIRPNGTTIPPTAELFSSYYIGGRVIDSSSMYLLQGTLTMQKMIYDYYLTTFHDVPLVFDKLALTVFPTAAFKNAVFLQDAGSIAPLIIVLGFLFPVSQMTKRIVTEKELRIREAMLIMGVSEAIMYSSWLIVYAVQYAIVSLVMTVLIKVSYVPHSDFGIIYFLIFLFSLSTITLSGLIASFFSKARLSSLLSPLIYFVCSIPLFTLNDASGSAKSGILILSPSALSVGFNTLFSHEVGGGMNRSDITYVRDSPMMLLILIMLFVDFVLYGILLFYFDAVLPKEWGVRKSPFFIITTPFKWLKRACCSCCCATSHNNNKNNDDDHDQCSNVDLSNGNTDANHSEGNMSNVPKHGRYDNCLDGRAESGVFEPLTLKENEQYSVRVVGLCKKYKNGKHSFFAVNNLHWQMREGEISVLLGHNGAGKSTAMNMMTGMVKADAGDCYIYGKSVRQELSKVRQMIGFCPQHNILWPELTCREHLEYFGKVKGLQGHDLDEAIERMLSAVDLTEKANSRSEMLSGGQMRKLSVAIAFVGGSKLIFLDEPTAGMDVGARRHTWDMLKTFSAHHSILLTTHFMDEADLLGDTISIMNKGRLQCSGSNIYLKSKLGVGYVLAMSIEANAARNAITKLITSHISKANELISGTGEMSFRLPMEFKHKFPELLRSIDDNSVRLGISAYSIAATTLEEIFLKVTMENEEEANTLIDNRGSFVDNRMNKTIEQQGKKHNVSNNKEILKNDKETGNNLEQELQSNSLDNIAGNSDNNNSNNNNNCYESLTTMQTSCNSEQCIKTQTENDEAGVLIERPEKLSYVWNVERIQSEKELFKSQLKAMFSKRLEYVTRDRRTLFFQIICPVACVLLAMLLTLIKFFKRPSISISSELYVANVVIDVSQCSEYLNASIPFSKNAYTVELPSNINTTDALEDYLLDTYYNHEKGYERYGAIICHDKSMKNYTNLLFNSTSYPETLIGLYNLYNNYLQSKHYNAPQLRTVINPMELTTNEQEMQKALYSMMIAVVIMIPFTFIPSTYVGWLVRERQCKARHLQNVSGLFYSIYWLSNFIFDLACYIITMFLVIIVFVIFNRQEYIARETIGATIVLFLLYGISGIAMSYSLSFLFKDYNTAHNVVMIANFITGFLLVMMVSILSLLPSTSEVGEKLRWIFRLVPSYCVGEGISNLSTFKLNRSVGIKSNIWDMDVIGWPCVYLSLEIPFFLAITLTIDHPSFRQRIQRWLLRKIIEETEILENEDEDVMIEREAVINSPERRNDLVKVINLRKVYGNGKVAVKNITFGVIPGEVFGFLGTNGAGKTTTISILCQEFMPTSGSAYICGYDLVKDSAEALQCIGYCPQFDATLDLLTVEEHLYLYAGIRGIESRTRQQIVEGLLNLCELIDYRKVRSKVLSGGNRRKLSVAIALIGGPRVVFLDEPSAGMDPVARRKLWTAIETVAQNCSVVLTTHHLEEVEALAHRVAIMVDGTLRCIGNKTHLKNKYGSGYEVCLRISSSLDNIQYIEKFFDKEFHNSILRENRARRLIFELPANTKLANAFELLENYADQLEITDYSISNTSIEQVFLRISEEAEQQQIEQENANDCEDDDPKKNKCCACCCC